MLYFAYGSNLNHFQMKRRCKDSIFIKKINLKNFTLTFRSKYRAADIEPKKTIFKYPTERYLNVIKQGYKDCKLDSKYLKKALVNY